MHGSSWHCIGDRYQDHPQEKEMQKGKMVDCALQEPVSQSDVNQMPYNYIVEVTNRFKGLDLIECLKNYGWRFVTSYRRQ